MALYDQIGGDYDKSRHADPFITSRLYFHLSPAPNSRYLDVACGTGNYTAALFHRGLDISGIDQSPLMIDIARQKNASIKWLLSNVEALPFPDNSFSGVTCILATHHFADLKSAFTEIARVISNGPFVIFTATADQMKKYWLNEYFPQALKKSIAQMPAKSELTDALRQAGFKAIAFDPYEIQDDLEDLFLYSGKNRPLIYLDDGIRMNISTFAANAESGEIEHGCALLEADIQSGRIHRVMNEYSAESEGDYVFVTSRK